MTAHASEHLGVPLHRSPGIRPSRRRAEVELARDRVDLGDAVEVGDGLGRIRAVRDFQIVNGGQTTASIASCLRRDGADLSLVDVPMKLTVVPPAALDDLVPLISKFANTQNRIQEADFSANHPWHIALERLSRTTWTRPAEGAPRGTRWYYERTRGQYNIDGSRIYQIDNSSHLRAFDTDTGKELWELPLSTLQKAPPVLADGKIYVGNEEGLITVIRAGDTFEVLAENDLADYMLSSPAISDSRIFLRTEHFLYAIGKR